MESSALLEVIKKRRKVQYVFKNRFEELYGAIEAALERLAHDEKVSCRFFFFFFFFVCVSPSFCSELSKDLSSFS